MAVAEAPDEWLVDPITRDAFGGLPELRAAYVQQIVRRLQARSQWLPALIESVPQ